MILPKQGAFFVDVSKPHGDPFFFFHDEGYVWLEVVTGPKFLQDSGSNQNDGDDDGGNKATATAKAKATATI